MVAFSNLNLPVFKQANFRSHESEGFVATEFEKSLTNKIPH